MNPEMNVGDLQAAIEQASSTTHTREFEVGGQLLTFPRLSIGLQGAFESFIRAEEDSNGKKVNSLFSLAATRNKAAMAMAGVLRVSKQAVAAGATKERAEEGAGDKTGKPLTADDLAEAQKWAQRLQDEVNKGFEPYADRIFGGFTRAHMLFAIAQSLAMHYGPDITYTTDIEGEKTPISAPIDSKFADTLFSNEKGGILENVFLWAVGLSEQAEKGEEAQFGPGMSVEDIADKVVGDEENSEREQDPE
jgi:hypothetical protein